MAKKTKYRVPLNDTKKIPLMELDRWIDMFRHLQIVIERSVVGISLQTACKHLFVVR